MPDQHPVLRENPALFHLLGDTFAEAVEWKGVRYLDIREWFSAEGKWLRTKRAIRVDKKDLEAFAAKLPALAEWARGKLG